MQRAIVVGLVVGAMGCGGEHPAGDEPRLTPEAAVADGGRADAAGGVASPEGGLGDARSAACEGKGGAPGRFERKLVSRGAERTYALRVPTSYDASRPVPLIVAFHGFTSSPADIEAISHLDLAAEQKGFLVAFPAGTSGSWNAGACCGTARFTSVDDVGFATDLVDAISAEHCVDAKRVYATGFSNGGFLSHRLACEASGKFAAVASVSGVLGVTTCAPPRAVPVLQIHGSADPVVPYAGNAFLAYPPVPDTVGGWAKRNGCGAPAVEVSRQGNAHCDRFPACRDGADVELCTVDGGGHDWPGGGSLWSDAGPPAGFVATARIVEFFEGHALP